VTAAGTPGGSVGAATGGTLRSRYDVLLLDLDGTVYRGAHAVPGAKEALDRDGSRLLYVTNNASRRPDDVAAHLRELGFRADRESVVTSSQAAARLLADRLPAGSRVLVVGTDALAEEIESVALVPVRSADAGPVAVVQGHSPDTGWRILAEATLAVRGGALWVATNVDSTLPTERGLVLGNGAMVSAVGAATGTDPVVAGKPAAPLLEDAIRRGGARRPLVVGDRLDTDIEGAHAVGADSLLVLTGVSTVDDLLRARPEHRPTYVASSLASLDEDADGLRPGADADWVVDVVAGEPVLSCTASDMDIATRRVDAAMAALRTVLPYAWDNPGFGSVTGADTAARTVIASWSAARRDVAAGANVEPRDT